MTRAVLVTRSAPPTITDVELPSPGPGEALVDVTFSSVNYKDGLALRGDPGVARIDPLVPGIDVVGTIAELGPSADGGSSGGTGSAGGTGSSGLGVGARVVLNGAGAGETRHGGWASRAVVPLDALVALPDTIPDEQAAAIGTAGFTAMLSVLALERFVAPDDGTVVVTGASGGVGSVAIPLLATRGYRVAASTGRPSNAPSLERLGAAEVIDRATLSAAGKPMQRAAWAGAVDSVGGDTLANLLASTRWGGAVTACGLAQGTALHTTVLPFILRAVSLLGINSVDAPADLRRRAWERLATDLDPELLAGVTRTVSLAEAIGVGADVVTGGVHGRTVVAVNM
jgi:acrylyl-CoA reductase (NADPH)